MYMCEFESLTAPQKKRSVARKNDASLGIWAGRAWCDTNHAKYDLLKEEYKFNVELKPSMEVGKFRFDQLM
jgi:hypothetical protein